MEATPQWKRRYVCFYDAYYYELLAGVIINRWQRIDFYVSILVALTASGSAFAGLQYWTTGIGKTVWTILVTVVSVVSITHGIARVSSRLQQQAEIRRDFSLLRHSLQVILDKMVTKGDSPELENDFSPLLARFGELESKLNPDLLSSPKLEENVQQQLNRILDRLGFNENGIIEYDGGKNDANPNS